MKPTRGHGLISTRYIGFISTYTYLANYVYVVVDCMTKLDLS